MVCESNTHGPFSAEKMIVCAERKWYRTTLPGWITAHLSGGISSVWGIPKTSVSIDTVDVGAEHFFSVIFASIGASAAYATPATSTSTPNTIPTMIKTFFKATNDATFR